jgi:hypothetical protein
LAGFATRGVGWLSDGWPVASCAAFGRPVRRPFLLLLFLLLLLLLWILVYDMCNFRGHGLIEEFIKGVKSAAGGRHRSNFVLERVEEACLGNVVEDFFMLLKIAPNLSPISFQTIHIGSDRFLSKLYVSLHQCEHRHASLVLIPINFGHLW